MCSDVIIKNCTHLSNEKKQYEYYTETHADNNINEDQFCVLKKNAFTEKFFSRFFIAKCFEKSLLFNLQESLLNVICTYVTACGIFLSYFFFVATE